MSNKRLCILFVLAILASGVLTWQLYQVKLKGDEIIATCLNESAQETE